jgi:hypothetical protein
VKRLRVVGVAVAAAVLVVVMVPVSAIGQEAETITLKASRTKMKFGKEVLLSGVVSPVTEPQSVTIVDGDTAVAEVATDASGKYSIKITPRRNMKLRALWSAAVSEQVVLKVRPIVTVRLGAAKLFGRARVRGNVKPALTGERIKLVLLRYGKKIGTKQAALRDGRWFSTRMNVRKPGTLRARAVATSPSHLRAAARSRARETKLPYLRSGSSGEYVRLLEKRLIALGYYLPGADARFDSRTSDAMLAFNKVQRRARVGSVDAATWRKLASPTVPKPRHKSPKFHMEIDQTRQVLFTVRNGKVENILHTSTGAGGATRDGSWTVHRVLAGTSGGGLYYPSYFDGLRAIHGWPEVPTYPASHGCARVPMWAATWIFSKAIVGTRVYVYH